MMNEMKIGFVNGKELKKGDVVEFQIKRLAGKEYDPPVIHHGVVVTPVFAPFNGKGHYLDWIVQINPQKANDRLPGYEFTRGVMAIYGADIVNIL